MRIRRSRIADQRIHKAHPYSPCRSRNVMLDRFEALSNEFRYQQRPMGAPCPDLHVAQEVANNVFAIAAGTPAAEFSWNVAAFRLDTYANENRIPNAVDQEGAKWASDRS